jgi:hypothetical protein
VALADELERVARLAAEHGDPGDEVSAVLPAEPEPGRPIFVCAFDGADGFRSWLAVDTDGRAITNRTELRAAVSISALCEVAADAAGGGDLEDLVARLEELQARESPQGIATAVEAARALLGVLGDPPQLATPARLDEIGAATRRLEQELQPTASSPFAAAMRTSNTAVAELQREIEAGYRVELSS